MLTVRYLSFVHTWRVGFKGRAMGTPPSVAIEGHESLGYR